MPEQYTPAALAGKVDWEGGVLDAIECGIRPDEVPEGELRDLWSQAYVLHAQIEPVVKKIEDILDAAYKEGN